MDDCCRNKAQQNESSHANPQPKPSSTYKNIVRFKVHGMDCAEEVTVLKREISPILKNLDQLGFNVINGVMTISSDVSVSTKEILDAISRTGMKAEIIVKGAEKASNNASFWQRRSRAILTLLSGVFALLGFLLHVWQVGDFALAMDQGSHASGHVPMIAKYLYGAAILSGSWFVLPKAWYALKKFRPDMNLLMVLAVLGAVFIGEWSEGATVSFLFALSLALESWSVGRARRAVQALMNLSPPKVLLQKGDSEVEVKPEEVAIGSKFIVKPGERIPLDGKVLQGVSDLNQAPITGESTPIPKSPGDDIFAGSINGDAMLVVESTKTADNTTLAHIINMVSDTQGRRAPSEEWVERFARIYTPIVMIVAVLIAIFPPLLFQEDWSLWFYRSLVLLVIACPCALVISTPVSIVAGLAAAARNGVLVKGGMYLEIPARLKTIAFDKTGTLTQGKLAVAEIVPMNAHTENELLALAAGLENGSTHPIARAIMEFAKQKNVEQKRAQHFKIIQGKGACGIIDGDEYWLGSHKYLEERNQETPEVHHQLEAMSASGKTVVVIGNDKHVCGFIGLSDQIRPETPSVLNELRRIGIQKIVMLTGDNQGTANVIARIANVDEARAGLLPADKVTEIESLVRDHQFVAMVGDGINDAPAMARASIGIAMGAAGSDVAIETADIALMADDLGKLPWLIEHAHRTLKIIKQNIYFSLGVKALFVVLSFTNYASLWAAIFADMGASLVVIFNGLRLINEMSVQKK